MATTPLRQAEAALAAQLSSAPTLAYDAREAQAIARQLAEALVGRTQRLTDTAPLAPALLAQWQAWSAQLLAGVPLQYVLGRCEFDGMLLQVSPTVLIPRPETEELVRWADALLAEIETPRVVDVGTGSGCIALALARRKPMAQVAGVDVSPDALAVAAANGQQLSLAVQWLHLDVTAPTADTSFGGLDLLVSNPPYVPPAEAPTLAPHVVQHEPHLALFTPTADALHFYRRLVQLAPRWLRPGGALLVELHSVLAEDTRALFLENGLVDVELRADLQGRPRMLLGRLPA